MIWCNDRPLTGVGLTNVFNLANAARPRRVWKELAFAVRLLPPHFKCYWLSSKNQNICGNLLQTSLVGQICATHHSHYHHQIVASTHSDPKLDSTDGNLTETHYSIQIHMCTTPDMHNISEPNQPATMSPDLKSVDIARDRLISNAA